MSYKIIDLPPLGRTFNSTDIIEVSANGTGSYKANIGNFTLGGVNYIFVNANSTPANNGQAVKDAYTLAQSLTPNGAPRTATNRITILLSPGYYTFNEAVSGQFIINTSYIDFVSLSGQTDVYFSSIELLSATVGGIDIFVSGIDTTKNGYYFHKAFAVTSYGSGMENIVVKNCIGDRYSFSSFSSGFTGVYENCKGGLLSFCSAGNGVIPPIGITGNVTGGFSNFGTIKDCYGTEGCFCTSYVGTVSGTVANYGTIENCVSNDTGSGNSFCISPFRALNAGRIINCRALIGYSFVYADDVSFGTGAATNTGEIINCQSVTNSFVLYKGANVNPLSALNQGRIFNCQSNTGTSFVVNQISNIGTNSGIISNCVTGVGPAFCGSNGANSGTINECLALNNAFCKSTPANIVGNIFRCTMPNDTWVFGPTGGGDVVLGIDSTGVVNF